MRLLSSARTISLSRFFFSPQRRGAAYPLLSVLLASQWSALFASKTQLQKCVFRGGGSRGFVLSAPWRLCSTSRTERVTMAASCDFSTAATTSTTADALGRYATLLRGDWALGPGSAAIKRLVPDLSGDHYKGQLGRVGVFGGSKDYTGAPFFAGMSALRTGADLAYVLTAEEAAPALKVYSPELMVSPVYSAAQLSDEPDELLNNAKPLLRKLHALVLGPGLGRSERLKASLPSVVNYARQQHLPISVDADALAMAASGGEYTDRESKDDDTAPNAGRDIPNKQSATMNLADYPWTVLTPNANEFRLLYRGYLGANPTFGADEEGVDPGSSSMEAVERLAKALGVTVVLKGKVDVVSNGTRTISCAVPGGLKRCGGIGDVLSGTMGTMLAWVSIQGFQGDEAEEMRLWAAWWACAVTRHASRLAYETHGRAMSATHVLEQIGGVLEGVVPSPSVQAW